MPYDDHAREREYEHDRDRARERERERRPSPGPGGGGRRGGSGGIPDSLLIGVLAFLLGFALFIWTATGLSGLFSHGSWPRGVTFGRTPSAVRSLITEPHDLAAAWPGTPASQLSGYGLFWGVFISQVLVLVVLTVFALGTITRARAVRAARKYERGERGERHARRDTRDRREHGDPPVERAEPAPPKRLIKRPAAEDPHHSPGEPDKAAEPPAPATPAVPSAPAVPLALSATEAVPASPASPVPGVPGDDPQARVREAPGAALVVTDDPELWAATKDARAKLGPVHLFDPTHLCDTPNRLRWSPHHGCADRATAAARATAMLEPLRSPRPIDAEIHGAAQTLLRCWLHAAALDDRPFREVHRWALSKTPPAEPVHTLRTHPKASSGSAGELEATLTAHPERRRVATELVRRALTPLSQLHVRNACTAARADRVALESFVNETGTLYVVAQDPQIMPVINALTQSVAEHGRRMATRSPASQLDPPLTTVLALDPAAARHDAPHSPEP